MKSIQNQIRDYAEVRLWDQIRDQFTVSIWDEIRKQTRDEIYDIVNYQDWSRLVYTLHIPKLNALKLKFSL